MLTLVRFGVSFQSFVIAHSGELALKGSGNNFENGQTDEFEFELPDLRPLQRARIWHDNSGIAAG